MTSQQLEYFLKLAEELNFTSVANQFYITQPTLSRQIMNLEGELGFPLFFRGKNTIRLTPEGRELYHQVLPMASQLRTVIQQLQKQHLQKINTISIGIMNEQLISNPLLLGINAMHQTKPDIHFQFTRASQAQLWQGIYEGSYDIINHIYYPQNSAAEDICFLPLEKEDMFITIEKTLEPELPDVITHEQLSGLLNKYPLYLPRIDAPNSFSPAKELLENLNMKDIPAGLNIQAEGDPLSVPMHVIAKMGISIANKSNLFSVDPNIRTVKVAGAGHYIKGIYYNSHSNNPHLPELLGLIREYAGPL